LAVVSGCTNNSSERKNNIAGLCFDLSVICLTEKAKLKRMRLVWAILLCIAFPFAILYPFFDAHILKHVPIDTVVPFEFSNSLLFTSSILFGFTSLIIVSKEWIDKRVWAVLVPPLTLIILSGVAIGNLALGTTNSVEVLLFSSASFNANVVSTGFVVGYVTRVLPKKNEK
jgi:hypothetical protein